MSLLAATESGPSQLSDFDAPVTQHRIRRRTFDVLERADDGDRLSQLLDLCLISLILLSATAIILESIEPIYAAYQSWFFYFETFTVGVFSIEYLLRLWCCVEAAPTGEKAWRYRLRYMRSGAALIDLAAIFPFYLMLFGAGGLDMRFLRMFRLLRVLKLTRYSAALNILGQALKENARPLAAAFFILLMVMLVAATGMYHFEREAQPEAFSSIPAAMWWAFATLTTVGYGDITPITAGGRVFGALITVLGLGMVALPTGILASAYTEQLRRRSERYRRKADQALQDGVLTDSEVAELEELRRVLGLDRQVAEEILGFKKANRSQQASRQACPHCGHSL
jgi:voltage-gated potassium channel